jgi:lipoprotein-anchoring transpeptidase ErfK/SrfK
MSDTYRRAAALFISIMLCVALLQACSGVAAPNDTPAPGGTGTAQAAAGMPEPSVTRGVETSGGESLQSVDAEGTAASLSPEATPTASQSEPPSPTATQKPKPKATPKPYALPYVLYLEKGSHTITVYGKDASGGYTKVVKRFLTATGKTSARTPTGTFYIGKKERWHTFGSNSYAQYATQYKSGLYIHSPIYRQKNNNTMLAYTYQQIGSDVSAGCLRTYTGAAYWIYKNCAAGTKLIIVNGAPEGTSAGAPPAIAGDATYDPTDPNAPDAAPAPSPTPETPAAAAPEPTAAEGGGA